jgi:hypothetical protein
MLGSSHLWEHEHYSTVHVTHNNSRVEVQVQVWICVQFSCIS